jgi:hypothetical protein
MVVSAKPEVRLTHVSCREGIEIFPTPLHQSFFKNIKYLLKKFPRANLTLKKMMKKPLENNLVNFGFKSN